MLKSIDYGRPFPFIHVLAIATTSALLSLTLIFALTLVPSLVSAANATSVTVNSPAKVNPGANFTVTISVIPGQQLAGMQLDLAYNSSVIDFVSISEGGLLSQGGNTTYFSPGTSTPGLITRVAGVITTPGGGVSTPGTFINLNFTAKSSGGTSAFTISNVVVGDRGGASLPTTILNGQIVVDRAPTINTIGNKSVNEGQTLQFNVVGSDPDGDPLTYSANNLPVGATFNSSSQTFAWTPNYAQSGIYTNITFIVSDGGLSSQQVITITVVQPYPAWDANLDGAVNVQDMISVAQHWGETGTLGWIPQDINQDLTVNVLDMVLIGQHWTG